MLKAARSRTGRTAAYIDMSDNNTPSPENKQKISYLPIGMCLGISVGIAIGAATGSIGVGMCIGVGIGMFLGAMIDLAASKKDTDNAPADETKDVPADGTSDDGSPSDDAADGADRS